MSFTIDCQWLDRQADTAEDDTLCELSIILDGHIPTRNVSPENDRASNAVVVSAWPLAAWFADNWWRLLYETSSGSRSGERRTATAGWKMAHCLPAADFGYLWPNMKLVSDDRYIRASMTPDPTNDIRLARYVGSFDNLFLDKEDFAHGVRDFLHHVDERLSIHFADDPLRGLIGQLFTEIDDESFARCRMIEAMTGYDPDEAPERLILLGRAIINKYGLEFFSAIASAVNLNFVKAGDPVASLENVLFSAREVLEHGIKGKFALGANFAPDWPNASAPWDYGRILARDLRGYVGMTPEKPLPSSTLQEWFEIGKNDLMSSPSSGESGICYNDDSQLTFRFANESSWNYSKNRRFFLARLTAACLNQPRENAWLVIGPGATWGQRMQRAFAAELLAPIAGIKAMLPEQREPMCTDIEKIANNYDVSRFTIVHSLANHGEIDRNQAQKLAA